VEGGVISPEQAARIRGLYPEPKPGLPWSTIVFSGLGVVIAGLGIILLLAYNWQDLHRLAKLGIILTGIIVLHGCGLRLFLRSAHWAQVGEAMCLMGSMLFGAGIWLVAQTYHIEEHFPNGFLLWGIGALALAWAMPSIAQALLAVIVLCIWGCSESWGFDHAMHWAPALLFAGGGLLAWRLKSLLLLTVVLAAFCLSLAANTSVLDSGLVLRVLLNSATAFVAAALLSRDNQTFPGSTGVWQFFGWVGFLFCLYLLTFPEITEGLLGWYHFGDEPHVGLAKLFYEWVPLALGVGLWGLVAFRFQPNRWWQDEAYGLHLEDWLLPLSALLCQVLAMAKFTEDKWFVAGVFNLVLLAIAGMWMARGGRSGLLRPMVLGSVLLIALATARFFDLFESLAWRGLAFLVVGGVLAAEGVLFKRSRKAAQTKEATL
jgi:hypothetical protein